MTLTPIRQQFLIAAEAAARLLAHPQVDRQWNQPSALADFTVRGLAGHLALQILYVPRSLAAELPHGRPVTLAEHYSRAAWIGAGLSDDANVAIRQVGEETAPGTAAQLAATATATINVLRDRLQLELAERVVFLPWAQRMLTLDDFLLTRLMELAVHSDDLAVSVHVPTPVLSAEALEPVLELLTALAVRRHGPLPILRALTRQERAPLSIAAF